MTARTRVLLPACLHTELAAILLALLTGGLLLSPASLAAVAFKGSTYVLAGSGLDQRRRTKVQWYGGDVGDTSTMLTKCVATSGYRYYFRDYQRAWLRGTDLGPVADGLWRIDLRPDPARIARILPDDTNQYRELGNSHIDVLIDYRYPVTSGRPEQ